MHRLPFDRLVRSFPRPSFDKTSSRKNREADPAWVIDRGGALLSLLQDTIIYPGRHNSKHGETKSSPATPDSECGVGGSVSSV